MGSPRIDPVLLIVGLVLALALALFVDGLLMFPADAKPERSNLPQILLNRKGIWRGGMHSGYLHRCTQMYQRSIQRLPEKM